MYNYSTNKIDCQYEYGEVLTDVSATGKDRGWSMKKLQNSYLATVYDDIDEHKAERLRECANFLVFKKVDNGLKLKQANFCRVRLCPICQWRRSLKAYNQLRLITDKALENDYCFIFVTLTIRNCTADDLSSTLDKLLEGFNRLTKYKDVNMAWKGFFRSLEVTHNKENDTYHPHIHTMVAVNKSYFKDRTYISQDELTELWQKAVKIDYIPQVDIRRIKGNTGKALAEVAKYAVKSSDMLYFDDWQLTTDTVRTLDKALNNRRFIGLGGILKQYHKELNLNDVEDGNLTNIDEDKQEDVQKTEDIFTYAWLSGYSQYRRKLF